MAATYAEARGRLVKRRKQYERLELAKRELDTKVECMWQRISWFTSLVKPLAIELKRETGAKSYRLGGPYGLNSEWHIDLLFADGRWATLSGILGNLDKAELEYHTGEQDKRFPADTLGAINGMNQLTEPLPLAAYAIVPLLRWREN